MLRELPLQLRELAHRSGVDIAVLPMRSEPVAEQKHLLDLLAQK
jgi:hypothetical protein